MPTVVLFWSQKSRNRRLFQRAFSQIWNRLSVLAVDDTDLAIFTALLTGGSVAAHAAIETCDSLKTAWGKGDDDKALALTEAFTPPMMSRLYRLLDKKEERPLAIRKAARRIAASNILMLFGHGSEAPITDIMNMDVQFNYDRDLSEDPAHSGMPLVELSLLFSSALKACGSESNVDPGKLTFPIEDSHHLQVQLLAQGGDLDKGDFSDTIGLPLCLDSGERAMYRALGELRGGVGYQDA